MKPFLEKIADKILKLSNDELSKTAIILPSRRSILFLKNHIVNKIEKPIFTPKFYSIEDFILKVSKLKLSDNLTLQFNLYNVYKNSSIKRDSDNFDAFLKWSQILLNDFNEIDRNLVDAEKLFCNLTNLKELEEWSLNDTELTDFQKEYIDFFKHLYELYSNFNNKIISEGIAYQGLIYKKASENIVDFKLVYNDVWFVGLNALTKSEKIIINYLKNKGIAKVFWDSDSHYINNHDHEAGYFLRENKKIFGNFESEDNLSKIKNLNIIGCARNIGQSYLVGDIVSNLSSENVEDGQTALVLPDETMLFPILNNLPENLKHVNITMGTPLNNSLLYNLFDILLSLHVKYYKNNFKGFYFKDLRKLLRHPYFNRVVDPKIIKEVDHIISKENLIFATSNSFSKIKCEIFHKILSKWDMFNIFSTINLIFDKLILYVLNYKSNLETEVLFTFQNIFVKLNNYIKIINEDVSIKTIHLLLNQVLGNEKIPFSGEPLKGLQIMGLLETRTIDFKNIIITNFNEEIIPSGKSKNSFIPFVLKKYFNMPTYEERDASFSYYFYRLIQKSENIYLIYNTQNDDFGSGEQSRFIKQLKAELSHFNINEKILNSEIKDFKQMSISVPKSESIKKGIYEWAKYKVSPSSLNTYINCPLKFFHQYIAKISSDDKMEEFIESSTLGNFVHKSLELSYKPYLNKKLNISDLKKIEISLIKNLNEIFYDKFKKNLKHGKNLLLLEVSKKMCLNYILKERNIIENGNEIIIHAIEDTLTHSIKLDDMEFNFFGKVDRIDSLNGQLRIIDYKTGFVNKNDLIISEWSFDNHFKKPKSFQLMMYSYLYFKKYNFKSFIKSGNYSFKNLNDGICFVKKLKSNNPYLIGVEEIDLFEDYLKKILNEIKNLNIPFNKTNVLCECDYCNFLK